MGQLKEPDDGLGMLGSLPPPNGATCNKVFLSKVIENEKITSDGHFQDTRKIVLDLT